MIFPHVEKKFPVLSRHVKIDVAVAAGKHFCRSNLAVLASLPLEDLTFIRVQADDVFLGRQRFLHRHIHMIASPGALAPIQRCQQARRREYTAKIVCLRFRWPARRHRRISGNIQKTAYRQSDKIAPTILALGTALTESRDRRHDDTRIDGG